MRRALRELPTNRNTRSSLRFFTTLKVDQSYELTASPELTSLLKEIDQTKSDVTLKRSQAHGGLQLAIQNKLRGLWTYHTNAIEGSKLSLGDTLFYIQEGLTVSGKPLKDFLDVEGHIEALDYIEQIVKNKRQIDTHLLRTINHLLCSRTPYIKGYDQHQSPVEKPMSAGSYKTEENYVIQPNGSIHQYTPPYLVADQMSDLCQWISQRMENLHPVCVSAIAHYNYVRIHPFQDGNGRGARLLMNLILLKHGYTPAVIDVNRRAEYLASLQSADQGNLLPFTFFVADSLQKSQSLILDEINRFLENPEHNSTAKKQ